MAEETYQVNFPIPRDIGRDWGAKCDAAGLTRPEDLAGMLYFATLLPCEYHRMFRDIALNQIAAYAKIDDVHRKVQTLKDAMQAILDEDRQSERPQTARNARKR